jgi:hypothetical protein
MYIKTKYIKTRNNQIIVFSGVIEHSVLKHLDPISAGFISIGIGEDKNPSCTCYGESISLGLQSDPSDTELAMRQILGNI